MADYDYPAPYSLDSKEGMVTMYEKSLAREDRQAAFLQKISHQNDLALAKEENSEINLAKSSVASLINSYHTAESGAMREQVVTTMKDYYSYLPFPIQKQVDPYINNSPASPIERSADIVGPARNPNSSLVFSPATPATRSLSRA